MANTEPVDPQFTLGDRYRKAREHAGLSQEELADEIGVSARTISRYETDTVAPRRIVRRQWALRCGVREAYLLDEWAARDSNPEPAELLPEAA